MLKAFIIIILFTQLFAKNIIIGQLISVFSNTLQIFKIQQKNIQCLPYGILTLDEIMRYKKINIVCKKEINTYFIHHPYRQYFSLRHLSVRGFYTLILKNKQCLIYAKGQKSLSELLLQNGLAIINPRFNDNEFKDEFLQAQNYAKYHKLGIWSNNILMICALGMYKS